MQGQPPLRRAQNRLRPSRASEVCVYHGRDLCAALIAGARYHRLHRNQPITAKNTIVLADFDNKTGESVFDDTLKQALSVDLEQSPYLDIASDRTVSETLQMMGRKPDARLTSKSPARSVSVPAPMQPWKDRSPHSAANTFSS